MAVFPPAWSREPFALDRRGRDDGAGFHQISNEDRVLRRRSTGDERAAAFLYLPQLQMPRSVSHAPQRHGLADVAGWILAGAMHDVPQEVLRFSSVSPGRSKTAELTATEERA
jgi:hypothetical protein